LFQYQIYSYLAWKFAFFDPNTIGTIWACGRVSHGKNVTQDKDIVDEFSKFFTSIGPNLANNIADNGSSPDPLSYVDQVTNVFHFHSISSYELKGEIQNMQM
jgi:hypothetical protein